MAWLIMNDEVDYASTWYPTHIVGANKELIPVFIGASNTMIRGLVGIYVKDEDYEKIRHDKAYIFIHDPEVKDGDINDIDWTSIEDVADHKVTGRVHFHMWKDIIYEEENSPKQEKWSEGGNA